MSQSPSAVTPGPRRRIAASARQRTWSRVVHLVGAGVLGTSIYGPPVVAAPLHIGLQLVVVPAVTVTGLFLWKQAQIRSLLRRHRGHPRRQGQKPGSQR
ncbi:hypothetical protein [uncultured Amnibacterium sp.]|uniref:hypothetical protein n=1 Tax=uncultured Amnibacterium sp. TaxID=1631851 RepID=UPI0035CB8D69